MNLELGTSAGTFVFLNGRFIPEKHARVPVTDRGFLYGDGLFETMRVVRGQPFRWAQHLARLQRGAAFLKLRPPLTAGELLRAGRRLIELNALPEAVLRLTLTRGSGPRGYSPRGADSPTLLMTLDPAPPEPRKPPRLRLITSTLRVAADDPLAAFKTCNKLPQVLARAEADTRGRDEALLLNTNGHLAEATASNVFWIEGNVVCTPPLRAGALPGVTRATVLELCAALGVRAREMEASPEALSQAAGVFLTRTVAGVVEAVELDGTPLNRSPIVGRLRAAYRNLLAQGR